jgi:hypothetical protein
MVQRIAMVVVLSATTAAFSPSFAQTIVGTAVGGVSPSRGSSSAIVTLPSQTPQGGTMTISPGGTTSITAAPSAGGSTASVVPRAQPKANNQAPRRTAVRNAEADVAERPLTDCLNDAAAQQRSLDDCKQ